MKARVDISVKRVEMGRQEDSSTKEDRNNLIGERFSKLSVGDGESGREMLIHL